MCYNNKLNQSKVDLCLEELIVSKILGCILTISGIYYVKRRKDEWSSARARYEDSLAPLLWLQIFV